MLLKFSHYLLWKVGGPIGKMMGWEVRSWLNCVGRYHPTTEAWRKSLDLDGTVTFQIGPFKWTLEHPDKEGIINFNKPQRA